jgi:HSP20 family protein
MLRRALQVRNGADPFDDVNRLFDDLLRGWGPSLTLFRTGEPALRAFNPTVDVTEDEKAYRVTAELPGVEDKDVEVLVEDGVLTIKGEKKAETESKGGNVYRMERSYGSFQRSIAVPATVDEAKIEAAFKKGVLTITLPKAPEAQPQTKRIAVKGD